jgi:menaquinone-9 beta-reductase
MEETVRADFERPHGLHRVTLDELSAQSWDIAVVGAGPAGSVMAYQLARAGASVCLLDKASFPRFKPCGCCLNAAAQASLDRVGLGHVTHDRHAMSLRTLDVAAAGRRPARAAFEVRGSTAISRNILDSSLIDEAVRAGARFLDSATAQLVTRDAHGCRIRVQHAGSEAEVRACLVIAADGIGGTLLRNEPDLQPEVVHGSPIGAAVTLAPAAYGDGPGPGVIWMSCANGGYVGAVRLSTTEVHLAAALDPRHVRNAGGPGVAAAAILRDAGRTMSSALVEQLETAKWRGTPALTRRRPVESRGILVIGDAAGYVEPFTGEGMAWAISSAIAAAPLALRSARGGGVSGEWTRLHHSLIRSRQRTCRTIAWMLRRPGILNAAIRIAGAAPLLAAPLLRQVEVPPALAAVEGAS